ncbi:TetR family transcriptional regulator [Amycolatopsis rhizosphaerae]|uniref:TetR family transcriptional regulator n=1 Tax=Amycolatopsis rhizosphaerae TaxID=2053003 RepID=A0A558DNP3_9PSEU|nr:TetR family transcriptional regulator [Amycolatopsis rhizosphaerae]
MKTVDWTARSGASGTEGLRERKKRQLRQQLTDTATAMFLERGFEAVRVAEIAEACDVSEKTVFNHFPTKEALVLDQPDATMAALRTGLADRDVSPVEAALRILAGELKAMTSWLATHDDPAEAGVQLSRFNTMIQTTPALRAYQHEMTVQLAAVAAEVLADRAGMRAEDPEPRIAATALMGLWQIQFAGLRTHLDGKRTPGQVERAVSADVRRAARLIDAGLATFATTQQTVAGSAGQRRKTPASATTGDKRVARASATATGTGRRRNPK